MGKSISRKTLDSLLTQATAAAEMSYSPYSGFKVGAALLLNNGRTVTGTNVENASLGLTICAERSALVRAVGEFGSGVRVEAIAVANLNGAGSPPCGACRQMLAEFAPPSAPSRPDSRSREAPGALPPPIPPNFLHNLHNLHNLHKLFAFSTELTV